MKAHKSLICGLVLSALLFWAATPASGIILHPAGEPDLLTWTDRPDNDVVGRWGGSSSCVAISSDCVISTRHQGSSMSSPIRIGGITYTIAQIWTHSTADLQIAKLNGANLLHFVDIYNNFDETDKYLVMGGYGRGRDEILQTFGVTYGYGWDLAGNSTLRFGTNRVKSTKDDSTLGYWTSDILTADFDGLNEGQSTEYESSLALYDSGGGWFIEDGNSWKVAGLSRAVERHYEPGHEGDPNYIVYHQTWFRNPVLPYTLDPDYIDAVRLSSYATWIYMTIPPRLPGELTGDDRVDFYDFALFTSYWLNMNCHYPDWCQGCDFEPDGDVDFADFAIFAYFWLQEDPPP